MRVEQYLDMSIIADFCFDKGAMTCLSLANNKLTRGALKAGKTGPYDSHYETDMAGMNMPATPPHISLHEAFTFLQGLSRLPMPSPAWGR
jgi:hypothetical protein